MSHLAKFGNCRVRCSDVAPCDVFLIILRESGGNAKVDANVLGVSVNYLLTGNPDDDPFDDPTPPELYQKQRKVLSLLEGLSDENYQAAVDYLVYLKHKEDSRK